MNYHLCVFKIHPLIHSTIISLRPLGPIPPRSCRYSGGHRKSKQAKNYYLLIEMSTSRGRSQRV